MAELESVKPNILQKIFKRRELLESASMIGIILPSYPLRRPLQRVLIEKKLPTGQTIDENVGWAALQGTSIGVLSTNFGKTPISRRHSALTTVAVTAAYISSYMVSPED